MKEYIDRNAAEQAKPEFLNEKVEDCEKAIYAKGWNDCNTQYRENILSVPAADVEKVRHGRWIDMGDFISCSACNATRMKEFLSDYGVATRLDVRTNYCPNCGARMDGGADDE